MLVTVAVGGLASHQDSCENIRDGQSALVTVRGPASHQDNCEEVWDGHSVLLSVAVRGPASDWDSCEEVCDEQSVLLSVAVRGPASDWDSCEEVWDGLARESFYNIYKLKRQVWEWRGATDHGRFGNQQHRARQGRPFEPARHQRRPLCHLRLCVGGADWWVSPVAICSSQLDWFNAELFPERRWWGPKPQEVGGGGSLFLLHFEVPWSNCWSLGRLDAWWRVRPKAPFVCSLVCCKFWGGGGELRVFKLYREEALDTHYTVATRMTPALTPSLSSL